MADQNRQLKSDLGATTISTWFTTTDEMHLFKSTFVPDQNSTLADFQANEVNFTGYAAFVMATAWDWRLSITGNIQAIYPGIAVFLQTAITDTDIAGGWWIEDTANTVLLLWNNFDAPVTFDSIADEALIKPSLEMTIDSGDDTELLFGP